MVSRLWFAPSWRISRSARLAGNNGFWGVRLFFDDVGPMPELPVGEPLEGRRIRRVLVRFDLDRGPRRHDPPHQLLHGLPGGQGIGASVRGFQLRALGPLAPPQGAAAPQLRIVEAVDVVGGPDQQVEIEGPVLAVLEGPQPVEHQGLLWCRRSEFLEEQQAVASETLGLALHTAVGEPELAGDLAEGGAPEQAMEEGLQEARMFEPVVRGEGL